MDGGRCVLPQEGPFGQFGALWICRFVGSEVIVLSLHYFYLVSIYRFALIIHSSPVLVSSPLFTMIIQSRKCGYAHYRSNVFQLITTNPLLFPPPLFSSPGYTLNPRDRALWKYLVAPAPAPHDQIGYLRVATSIHLISIQHSLREDI